MEATMIDIDKYFETFKRTVDDKGDGELMKKKAEVYSKVLKHEFSLEEASKELEKIFNTKISAEDVDTLLRLDCPEEVDENGRVVGTVKHG